MTLCFLAHLSAYLEDEVEFDLQDEDVEEPEDHGIATLGSFHLGPDPNRHVAQHDEETDVSHQHDYAHPDLQIHIVLYLPIIKITTQFLQ